MSLKNQKGIAAPLLLVLLLIAIIITLKLIDTPKIFKSGATGEPIIFRGADVRDGKALPKEGNLDVTNNLDVQIELNPPPPENYPCQRGTAGCN